MKSQSSIDLEIGMAINEKKINFISAFPIPNTKEDILEILALGVPEAKKKLSFLEKASNLGIGINNPTFPLDINTSTNNTAAYITNFTPSNGTNWSDTKVGVLSASYGTGSADNIGGEFLALEQALEHL